MSTFRGIQSSSRVYLAPLVIAVVIAVLAWRLTASVSAAGRGAVRGWPGTGN